MSGNRLPFLAAIIALIAFPAFRSRRGVFSCRGSLSDDPLHNQCGARRWSDRMRQTWRFVSARTIYRECRRHADRAAWRGVVSALHHVPTAKSGRPMRDWPAPERNRHPPQWRGVGPCLGSGREPAGLGRHQEFRAATGAPIFPIIAPAWELARPASRYLLQFHARPSTGRGPTLPGACAWRTCMRFDLLDFAAFDLFVLGRKRAAADYSAKMIARRRGPGLSGDVRTPEFRTANNVISACSFAAEHLSSKASEHNSSEYAGIPAQMAWRGHPSVAFSRRWGADRRGLGFAPVLPSDRSRPFPLWACRKDHGRRKGYRLILFGRRHPGKRHHPVLGLSRRHGPDNDLGHERGVGSLPALAYRQAGTEIARLLFRVRHYLDGDVDMWRFFGNPEGRGAALSSARSRCGLSWPGLLDDSAAAFFGFFLRSGLYEGSRQLRFLRALGHAGGRGSDQRPHCSRIFRRARRFF